ncbi:MAG TPA: LapA family protein [Actinomycetota bacterium]|nr:LapA family protein [Actinomycetota bacterium]
MDPSDDPPSQDERSGDGGATWTVRRSGPNRGIVAAVLVVVVLVVFAALNFRPVRVNFLAFTTRARVVTVILVAAALGFVVGWFVGRPARHERRHLREWRASRPAQPDER